MDIPANISAPPPPYAPAAGMSAAVPKDAHVTSQQNTGNISITLNIPNKEESKPKSESLSQPQYMPQVQAFPQPQMNQVPFQQPQFQQVQVQQPQFQQVQVQQFPVQQPQYIVNQQPVIYSGNLGPNPSITTCTNCKQRVTSNVIYKPGAFAWVMCFVFSIFCLICGCCLIPFFMDSFKDAHHSCPQCNASLHIHKQL